MLDGFEVIFRYTRAQAIEDGILIDVTVNAREAEFRVTVAVTASVWAECVAWNDKEGAPQDKAGRLWDVLWMAAQAAWGSRKSNADRLTYQVRVVPSGGQEPKGRSLVLHFGPGDAGEPVMTIMLPGED